MVNQNVLLSNYYQMTVLYSGTSSFFSFKEAPKGVFFSSSTNNWLNLRDQYCNGDNTTTSSSPYSNTTTTATTTHTTTTTPYYSTTITTPYYSTSTTTPASTAYPSNTTYGTTNDTTNETTYDTTEPATAYP